ncbi:MAG TPA: hypothetical protein ENJ00_11460, partial [Phycisphaerales bacterium]|nr:hypothetical protein [Phycisphaerales bacterium]
QSCSPEQVSLLLSDGSWGYQFGSSVSVSGEVAAVGARGDRVNGINSGAVSMYRFDGSRWVLESKLAADDGQAFDKFGESVSVSGSKVVIGAPGIDVNGYGSGGVYVFRFDGSNWIQEARLIPSDGQANEFFGSSVSISGDTIVVGAPYANDFGDFSGTAYVFHYNGSEWIEQAKLLAKGGMAWDKFGGSVAVSGDAVLVGALGSTVNGRRLFGSAYVFRFDGTDWIQEAKLIPDDSFQSSKFGTSVSISGDLAFVGAPFESIFSTISAHGSVYVFRFDGSQWVREARLVSENPMSNDQLGTSVSGDGDTVVAGAPLDGSIADYSGSATIFHFDGVSWTQQTKILPPDSEPFDRFGRAVAYSNGTAFIGVEGDDDTAGYAGKASVYQFDGSGWHQTDAFVPDISASGDMFGSSMDVDGDLAVIGAFGDDTNGPISGSVYIFRFDGSQWVREARLVPDDADSSMVFGNAVSISGTTALIGAEWDNDNGFSSGSAYIFRYNGTDWVQEAKLLPDDGALGDVFGSSVSISGDHALVGAYQDDDNGLASGSVYAFRYTGTDWVQEAKLVPNDGQADAQFGYSVSLFGGTALIGALDDRNGEFETGSVYVFRFDGTDWVQSEKLLADDQHPGGDRFGNAVDLSEEIAVIGAYIDSDNGALSGSAYVFRHNGTNWVQESKLLSDDGASGDRFGASVSISGDTVVIGATGDDDGNEDAGSAYVFRFDGSSWQQAAKLLSSNGSVEEEFGSAAAIKGGMALVGARKNSFNGLNSGAVYRFDLNCIPRCPADVDDNGILDADDFTAWLEAYNTGDSGCDQNADGACDSSDFGAWIANFNSGCP